MDTVEYVDKGRVTGIMRTIEIKGVTYRHAVTMPKRVDHDEALKFARPLLDEWQSSLAARLKVA